MNYVIFILTPSLKTLFFSFSIQFTLFSPLHNFFPAPNYRAFRNPKQSGR